MKALDTIMMQSARKEAQARRNLRLGLILGGVALAIFCGAILRYWLQSR